MEGGNVVTLTQQKQIAISGVESVDSFGDTQITLTVCGKRMQILGEGLKVTAFSKANASFCANGLVTAIKYLNAKEKLAKRLFK